MACHDSLVTSSPSGELRRPLFVIATVLSAVVVMVELGLGALIGGGTAGVLPPDVAQASGVPPGSVTSAAVATQPAGAGIAHLALVDGLVLFTMLLIGSSLVVSQRLYGRYQGFVTFVVGVLWIVGALALAAVALSTLLLMIGLFVAIPFGTIVYLIVWGFFPVTSSAVVLALLLFLKLLFMAALIAAQPGFLKVKGLVILVSLSMVLQLALGFIQQFLPSVVVSIGDQCWALVTTVVALVWAVVMTIGAVPGMVNAVRASRPKAPLPPDVAA